MMERRITTAGVDEKWASLSEEQRGLVIAKRPVSPNGFRAAVERATAETLLPAQTTISIIVTARNYGRFLKDCLTSCLNQTCPALEVIYSDDASTDDSLEIARSIPGVKVIGARHHMGAPAARNRGAKLATGDVLLFVDGDDQLTSCFVENCLTHLTREHSFAYGDVQEFGETCTVYKVPQWSREILWERNICSTSSAVWADLFWKAGGWREAFGNCWDWDLWLRVSQFAEPVHCGSILLYRRHPQNDSKTTGYGAPGNTIEGTREKIQRQIVGIDRPASRAHGLRVGFLFPSLELGGAQQWLISLLKHLSTDKRIELSGVALTGYNPSLPNLTGEVAKHAMLVSDRLHDPSVVRVKSTAAAIEMVASESDVLVCWSQENLAQHVAQFSGPVVLVSHGCMNWDREMAAKQQARATHFVGVSKIAADSFRGIKATVLRNGIELERLKTTESRATVRRRWGLKPSEIGVGYVGRLSWEKNPEAIALAVAHLGKPYRAVYVGDGWKAEDVGMVVRHSSRDPIFTGLVEPIGNALQALDCFVLASPQEGMSLALCEAWAAGLPTVSTSVGAVPELEEDHGQLTVSVPVGPSPEQLAKAVKVALSAKNRPVVARAKKVMREHYSAEAMAERWGDYLCSLSAQLGSGTVTGSVPRILREIS
jgi:glycosyltransferase involved in cell wall biosynthesis